ncbi:MAG: Fe-S cluster assembly ATPase SufC [Acidimicrobiia bacterium]|nr:Fe-S cluster assembly ATPase SufC [Acidimicrobiia bacterium]
MTAALAVRDLDARLGDLHILKGVDLEVPYGEVHALMGPNGSGKSTLCHAIMGKPGYEADGTALVGDADVIGLPVHERARLGLFEGFQYPVEIPGVTLRELLGEIADATGEPDALRERLAEAVDRLGMERFLERPVNEGLSGGEKKRSEMLQLLALAPRVAILDEIDSGLDIDAVREVAAGVEALRSPDRGVLVITHYSRILRYMDVDRVHIMMGGRIVKSGGPELAEELEAKGYDTLRKELGLSAEVLAEETSSTPDPLAGL